MVVARTFSPNCEGKLSTFIVERAVANYDVRKLDTMVLRCSGTAELASATCAFPAKTSSA